jgi:hypothetical protein
MCYETELSSNAILSWATRPASAGTACAGIHHRSGPVQSNHAAAVLPQVNPQNRYSDRHELSSKCLAATYAAGTEGRAIP